MKALFIILFVLITGYTANCQKALIVDQQGKGDYKSIQAAINSLTDSSATLRTILVRNGVYHEKIYIEKHNILIKGESREGTIIQQAIARDEWRCNHQDDWGVATMNVDGNDISLQNLTIINSYGKDNPNPRFINCHSDSTGTKRVTAESHQMALRTVRANRLRAVNCHFIAYGGDTVSPWNVGAGQFYFKDCIMEGGVDFYCPRGWAWAENCKFYTRSGPAAIWHDGSANPDSKTVLINCSFDGFKDFNLGRYHRDAQFYLINCSFSPNMANRDIYLVPTPNIITWGRRVYYFNSHRQGGDYAWHKDNISASEAAKVTPDWLFRNSWKPHVEGGSSFTPSAHVRLRKKEKGKEGQYGPTLQREVAPTAHQPNNFATSPIPYYQTEGPAWENDKVGFRLYLDVRNGKDVFGKTTSSMVMDTVGTYGDKYYHQLDKRWGLDLLKVGNSLGAGALSILVKQTSGDTIIRLGGAAVGKTEYEVLKDGPEEARFRITYSDWKVLDRNYSLQEEISIRKGDFFYTSSVKVDGLRGDEALVTGIVTLKADSLYALVRNASVIYTHARQSENNDMLGMAVMVPHMSYVLKSGPIASLGRTSISDTYGYVLPFQKNNSTTFRFYACWEGTDSRFKSKEVFGLFLQKEAQAWQQNSIKNTNSKTTKTL